MITARQQAAVCRLSLLGLWLAAAPLLLADTILGSKHDLTPVGPGPIRATQEREVCAFCHTPHHAISDTPLWNHTLSTATYTLYDSSTVKAQINQPTGSSKLCLSCHDGTVALGMVENRPLPIEMQGGVVFMPPGRSNLDKDLSDDHPISFTYDTELASDNAELRDPATLTGRARPDHNGQMQCTSCHDPHDNRYGRFLVMDNFASALCVSCHNKTYWEDSSHRNSTATWNGSGLDPWPNTTETTVAANACGNCHTPHHARTKPRLLIHLDEESNCLVCHNGNVAANNKDVEQAFTRFSVHPITDTTDVHDPMEHEYDAIDDLIDPPRHVECVDCHNPHASRNAAASAPDASGALEGVAGITAAGAVVNPINYEYELCFRCHADSGNKGPSYLPRHVVENNTRTEFSPSSDSYHPVVAPGKNPDVPSLKAPWQESSIMYCGDCHNNDQNAADGSGPRGPHGSLYAPILARQLEMGDNVPESSAAYALCYQCHDRTSILGDKSFKAHEKHVKGEDTACTTCHDPHGVAGNTHLINFHADYVNPSSSGRLEFIDDGNRSGTCYLECHGKDHNPISYTP